MKKLNTISTILMIFAMLFFMAPATTNLVNAQDTNGYPAIDKIEAVFSNNEILLNVNFSNLTFDLLNKPVEVEIFKDEKSIYKTTYEAGTISEDSLTGIGSGKKLFEYLNTYTVNLTFPDKNDPVKLTKTFHFNTVRGEIHNEDLGYWEITDSTLDFKSKTEFYSISFDSKDNAEFKAFSSYITNICVSPHTSLGEDIFKDMNNVVSIDIWDFVHFTGTDILAGCPKLKNIYLKCGSKYLEKEATAHNINVSVEHSFYKVDAIMHDTEHYYVTCHCGKVKNTFGEYKPAVPEETAQPAKPAQPTKTDETTSPTKNDEKESLKKPSLSIKKVKPLKSNALKKAKTVVKLKVTTNSTAKVTFEVTKTPKKGKNFISVKKNGTVTLKKNAPKGTYKIKVSIVKTSKYSKANKTISIKVS